MNNPGKLNKRILIQKKTVKPGKLSQQTVTWSDYIKCWAAVNGLYGKEYWEAARQNAENTVVFSVRHSGKIGVINPLEYRIIFQDKIYDIKNVDNVMYANETVKITAVAQEVNP